MTAKPVFEASAVATTVRPRDGRSGTARLLILDDDPVRHELLAAELGRYGYHAACAIGDHAIEAAREHNPDIVLIIDTRVGDAGLSLAQTLSREPFMADTPVVLSVAEEGTATHEGCLAAGIEDLLVRPVLTPVLAARLMPLRRLTTIRAELRNRLRTARRLGIALPAMPAPPATRGPYRVLIVADDPECGQALRATLGDEFSSAHAESPYAAGEMLIDAEYDALVLVPGADPERQLELSNHIRNNTRLFDLPVLMLASSGASGDPVAPYRRGVTVVLAGETPAKRLRFALATLVRRQGLRRHTRTCLRATEVAEATDPATGRYHDGFLRAHLDGLVDDAARWDKQLSVTLLACRNVGEIARLFGPAAADALMREVGGWITSLVRAEDVVGRINGSGFLVALPDTALEEAQIVGNRIAGVLLNTEFAVPGCDDALRVWIEVGCAAWAPGDSTEGHIARARRNLH